MGSLYEQFFSICRIYPNNNAIIYYETIQEQQTFTYSKINNLSIVIWEWLEHLIETNTCIGIFLNDDILLIPVILGIHKGKCSFISLSEKETLSIKHVVKAANIKYFLSTKSNLFVDAITLSSLEIENKNLILWSSDIEFDFMQHNNAKVAYAIKTSGSTGDPKLVYATHECINPNIVQLRDNFGITSDDIIYMGTPSTFDPFIIELYLTLTNGACAIMVSRNLKFSPEILRILFEITPITFLQTTPSLFRLWHVDMIKQNILSKKSLLRILAFGGEICPSLHELKQWKHEENETKIFYLYGITEVSCWAMIREIKMNHIVDEVEGIYLGEPLIETTVEIRDENGKYSQPVVGELYIGSKTRKCIMEGENATNVLSTNEYIFRRSGDLVKLHNGKIYYLSRVNDSIKRYGTKINLFKIEKKINNFENVENSCCVWITELEQLILFYKTSKNLSKDHIWKLIKLHLEEIEYPDYVHLIETFPLSEHGKISKARLKKIHENGLNGPWHIRGRPYFLRVLRNILPYLQTGRSFLESGGTSITALIIISKLEATTGYNLKKLMPMLLDYKISIDECMKYVDEIMNRGHVQDKLHIASSAATIDSKFNLKIQWTYNLDKCVDATPTLLQNKFVIVGSHSHKLVTLDARTGALISSLILSDRIESSVTSLSHDMAVVGCYDGKLYCFNPAIDKIKWTFKTGDMIKSKAYYIEEKSELLVTSYDKYLHSINSINGQLNWCIQVCDKPLTATPCVSKTNNSIICCSLGGTIACIDIYNASLKWSKKYRYPIFSSPIVIHEGLNSISYLFSEVDGTIHCINESGSEIWQYSASGSIYSSFHCYEKDLDTLMIIFGCHDKSIYCLQTKNGVQSTKPSLKWKCFLKSQVYATPNILELEDKIFVIGAATIGQVCIIDLDNGIIFKDININGEIYSSPIAFNDMFYFGCRDNNLYCIKVAY